MRCPVCRANVTQGNSCPRCRADLLLLVNLERARQQATVKASAALLRGEYEEARTAAKTADQLRHDTDSSRLWALAALLSRDFGGAWQAYQVARSDTTGK